MIFTDGKRLVKADSLDEVLDRLTEQGYPRAALAIDELADAAGPRVARAILTLVAVLAPNRIPDPLKPLSSAEATMWRPLRSNEYIRVDGKTWRIGTIDDLAAKGLLARLIDGEWTRV